MKNSSLNVWVRLSVFICGLLLLVVLKVPMWRIELTAPQYPEGLVLQIFPDKLGGDVAIVNGLNHYIGMKTLHADDFIEFTVLPYFIIFFVVSFILVALINRQTALYILTVLFLLFAVLAMADFWRWEYDYGHNLDPHAAIQVPGMSYQPPLLGYKQLLNFGAFSIPGIGGWIFFAVGVAVFALAVIQAFLSRKNTMRMHTGLVLLPFILFTVSGCNSQPEPIRMGSDACSFCKMAVSDKRFGAEVVNSKGKNYKFDDIQCMIEFTKAKKESLTGARFYFTDFETKHDLLESSRVFLLKSDDLKTPMNGHIAAFSSAESLQIALSKFGGQQVNWSDLIK